MNRFETNLPERPGGPDDRLLPWPKVKEMTGLSRTTAWRREKAGDFPLPVQISPGRVGWWESELTAWKASRAPRGEAHLPAFPEPRPLNEEPAQGVQAQPPLGLKPPKRRRTRRAPPLCEGQIAFEF